MSFVWFRCCRDGDDVNSITCGVGAARDGDAGNGDESEIGWVVDCDGLSANGVFRTEIGAEPDELDGAPNPLVFSPTTLSFNCKMSIT